MALDGRCFDLKLVPRRLAREQPVQRLVHRAFAACAQQLSQLHLLIVTEASVNGAGRGDPDTIAALAEILGHRRDETKPNGSPLHFEIAGGPASPDKRRNEAELALQTRSHLAQREIRCGTVPLHLAERHRLDQREVVTRAPTPAKHWSDFVFIEAAERDHVDLDPQPCIASRLNPAQHVCKVAAPGDVAETVGIAAIEADVDPSDSGIEEHLRMALKLSPVRGHRQLVETMADAPSKLGHEPLDSLADQRLPSGQTNPLNAACDEDVGQPNDLFQAEHIALRKKRHLFRHAVAAAKIAAIRHRHSDIDDAPAEAVDHRSVKDVGCAHKISSHAVDEVRVS